MSIVINGKSLHDYIEEQKNSGNYVEFIGGSTVTNTYGNGKRVTLINNGSVIIHRNGKRYQLHGERIEQRGNEWYVNGKLFNFDEEIDFEQSLIKIEIKGEVQQLISQSGEVTVNGDVNNLKTTSGDVSCNYAMNINTVSGDVTCKGKPQYVNTVSGDINC